ncbi:MAG: RHS repeat-associated core domain-containing protein [Kamptonema sp. SIO1D9]|nr:RHS repeat-associated core domain-containing protein [Kamptonema sp. SIO1D9]
MTTYFYDLVGNLVRTELPNGVIESREYDDLNRLFYLENELGEEIISSYHYELDNVGHRLSVTEDDSRKVEYKYDDLYRLVEEKITDPNDSANNGRTISYLYDNVGNRLSRVDSVAGVTTYGYNDNDWLLEERENGEVTTYVYDDNGNTVSRSKGNETITYTWDGQNRLVEVEVPDGTGIGNLEYQYDANGIRVASIVDGLETHYLVDDNRPYAQVLAEYNLDGTVEVSYVHGLDLISSERDGEEFFYLYDGHSGVRQLSDELGNVTDSYSYEAFGNLLSSTGNTENNYLYRGEQFDPNLGMQYLRARYYDQGLGRFTKRDDYEGRRGEPITLHKYLYGNNNPVTYTDPTGLFSRRHFSQEFGEQAHEEISLIYTFEHMGDQIYFGNPQKGVGVGLNPLLRTDLVNHTTKTYLEIKPFTPPGYTKGKNKMKKNKNSLEPFGYKPDGIWKAPPLIGTATVMGKTLLYFNDFTGIIFYTDDPNLSPHLVLIAGMSEREQKKRFRQLREGALVVTGLFALTSATPSIAKYTAQLVAQIVSSLSLTRGLV